MIDIVKAFIEEAKKTGPVKSIYVDSKTYDSLAKEILSKSPVRLLDHFDRNVSDMHVSEIPVYCDRTKEEGLFIQVEND